MINPIKINLFLNDNCPIDTDIDNITDTDIIIDKDKDKDIVKVGGNPSQVISKINNNIFKYINGLFINASGQRNNIYFKFNDKLNNKKDIIGSTYLGKGGLTSVFSIKYLNQDQNLLPQIQDKNLVIRIFESFYSDDISEWIQKYNEQKILFDINLIDIYLYGQITLPGKIVCFYTITRFYNNSFQIENLNYNQTLNYFNSFLDFIIKVKSNNYYYRDLKFSNIGLDLIDSVKCVFVVLDYDDITLTKSTDDFFTQFNDTGCDNKYCAGTLIPYFIIKDYLTLQNNWLRMFDKVYVVGMVDIIINLFFIKDKNFTELVKIIFSPSKYTSCIHYYQYLTLFDNKDKYKIFDDYLNNLVPKFVEIDNSKKQTLLNISKNLLSTNYISVDEPELTKIKFQNDIVMRQSIIETTSGTSIPIDEIEFIPIISSSENSSKDLRFKIKYSSKYIHNKKNKYFIIQNHTIK